MDEYFDVNQSSAANVDASRLSIYKHIYIYNYIYI